jgi:prepilin-type N-terminal cleavage/methylation domain-containing protein/prepilin-type processing-associated H-X9-DG protein
MILERAGRTFLVLPAQSQGCFEASGDMMREKKGFTLVELLVVISIIALLFGILIPVLGRAREVSKLVVCQSNLRQLAIAWMSYAQSNDERMCYPFMYQSHKNGMWAMKETWIWAPYNAQTDQSVMPDLLYDTAGADRPTREEEFEGIRRGTLYRYAQNVKAFHCGNDKIHWQSYSIPDCLNGEWQFAPPTMTKPWNVLTKMLQLKSPATKYVFLEDADPRTYVEDSFELYIKQDYWSDPVSVAHMGKSGFAFADGHAEQRKWSDETTNWFKSFKGWNGTSGPVTLKPVTPGGIDDLNWMKQGYAQ